VKNRFMDLCMTPLFAAHSSTPETPIVYKAHGGDVVITDLR